MTDQILVMGYGKLEREYPLVACSDGKFTDVEFERWNKVIGDDHLKLLTLSQITHKIDDINYLLKHPWTSKELQQKLDEQNRLAHLIKRPQNVVSSDKQRREELLHQRNLLNRKQNEKDVHEALLRERREKKMRNEKARREQAEMERLKADPDYEKKWDEETERKRKEEELKAKLASRYVPKDYKHGGFLQFSRPKTDDEVIGSLDLGIDVDIC
jgi:hypothetical protein